MENKRKVKKIFIGSSFCASSLMACFAIDSLNNNNYKNHSVQQKNIWNPITTPIHDSVMGISDIKQHLVKEQKYGNFSPITITNLIGGTNINVIFPNGHNGFFVAGEQGKLDLIKADGFFSSNWTTKTFLNNSNINSIVSDGKDGFFLGGDDGKLDHIKADGTLVSNWATKNFIGNSNIRIMISDDQGGFFLGGDDGKLDHIKADGTLVSNWTTKTFLSGSNIRAMISDGKDGFFIGGDGGKLDHIKFDGTLVSNWTTKTFLNNSNINSIISDDQGGFFLGGDGGKLDHIKADGTLVSNWSTKTILGGSNIRTMVSDGKDGFVIGGDDGKLDHIKFDGTLVSNWTTKTLLDGSNIKTLVSDGQGGFFLGGFSGKFLQLDSHLNIFNFNSWTIPFSEEENIYPIYENLLKNDWKNLHWQILLDPSYAMIYNGHGRFLVGSSNGTLILIKPDGSVEDNWQFKTLLSGKDIITFCPDGQGGFFVGGSFGKLDHINPDGTLVSNWTTKTLLGGVEINAIVPDGQGGFLVGGTDGKLDHIRADGTLFPNWTTKTLLGGKWISAIVSDGQGGFFVGGYDGKLDHINPDGTLVSNWTTKTLLGGMPILSMSYDGQGGFFAGGVGGRLDHINANGFLFDSWQTKQLINSRWMYAICPDGQGGFLVGGENGQLDHIKADGSLVPGWQTKTLIRGETIFFITPDNQGGFFVGGSKGYLDHIDSNGDLTKAETKEQTIARWHEHSIIQIEDVPNIKTISFIGISGQATFDPIILDRKKYPLIEYRYVVTDQSIINPPDDSEFKTIIPTNLANRQTLWVKPFGKSDYFNFKSVVVAQPFIIDKLREVMFNMPDGLGGTIVGWNDGKIEHFDKNGTLLNESTLLDGKSLFVIAPDGKGGYFVGGASGKLDHVKSDFSLVDGWHTKVLLGGKDIRAIVKDGYGGFFIGGTGNEFDHIDADGNISDKTSVKADLPKWRGIPLIEIFPPDVPFIKFQGENGSATFDSLPIEHWMFPSVEYRYAVTDSSITTEPSDSEFSNIIPRNLRNGQLVWVKPFIKNSDYVKFKSLPKSRVFSIKKLKIFARKPEKAIDTLFPILAYVLAAIAAMALLGFGGYLIYKLLEPKLLNLKLKKIDSEIKSLENSIFDDDFNDIDNQENEIDFSSLKNESKSVWAKEFVEENSVQFKNKPQAKPFVVLGLKDAIDNVDLVPKENIVSIIDAPEIELKLIKLIGKNKHGTFNPIPIDHLMFPSIEYRYAVTDSSIIAEPSDSEFSNIIPRNLRNGQNVWVKLFTTSDNVKFSNEPIAKSFKIENLKRFEFSLWDLLKLLFLKISLFFNFIFGNKFIPNKNSKKTFWVPYVLLFV